MLQTNAPEEYLRAMHMGQKEKKKLEAAGKSPFPPALEEVCPEAGKCAVHELPVQEIPIDRIVGTVSKSRVNVFSASFLPLPEPDSEFAMKWIALCRAHLSDAGISDPVECTEYLGNFYISEGNKRVSVFRYFGALRIPAKITRVIPADKSDPRVVAYEEFLEFHRATGLYDLQFRRPGDFAAFYQAVGKKPGQPWDDAEKARLSACLYRFKDAFKEVAGERPEVLAEDALLLFFRVYTYAQLDEMTPQELKKALFSLWGDVQASSEPEAINVKTEAPDEDDRKGPIGKLISGVPRHMNIAFIYRETRETSPWTDGHALGAEQMAEALGEAVDMRAYFHADSPSEAEALLDRAVAEGADAVFTTTPPLLHPTLKAAVRYPKVSFFSCSACKPLSSVRSYYCRTYEGKFITGLIAGAMAENDLVGFVGSYPISGVPAAINAFALGARMTNPRAKILLEWSCLPGDPLEKLRERGARVISNRDIPLPDVRCMENGAYGTVLFGEDGSVQPLASPSWMWGRLYEKIVRSILDGSIEKKEKAGAVNYWWGMDSGVIDVLISDTLPAGVRRLAEHFIECIRNGRFDPFTQELRAADGTILCDGKAPSSLELLQMERLSEAVDGRIPTYEELLPMSRSLVRELLLPGMEVPSEVTP